MTLQLQSPQTGGVVTLDETNENEVRAYRLQGWVDVDETPDDVPAELTDENGEGQRAIEEGRKSLGEDPAPISDHDENGG